MACSCGAASGGDTILQATAPLAVTGAGTATSPYLLSLSSTGASSVLQVRDSGTVDFSLIGSGTQQDPWIISASTASAAKLATLGDVAASPSPSAGRVPMWIGATNTGQFELRTPGVRYTTSATRGVGLYQGELARDTDTQKRWEWDGSQWLSLDVASSALDSSVVQNAGTVTSSTDWNSLKDRSGIYQVQAGITSTNNGPNGAYNYGTLEVLKSGNSVTQNYFSHGNSFLYSRTKYNDSDWTSWQRQALANEVDNVRNTALFDIGRITWNNGGTNSFWQTYLPSTYYSKGESDSRYAVKARAGQADFGANVYTTYYCEAVRAGDMVTFRWSLGINGTKNVNDNLVRVPEGFRPRDFAADTVGMNGTSTIWPVAVDTDGWLRLRAFAHNGGNFWGTVTYPSY